MFSRSFLPEMAERAIRTFAQSLGAFMTVTGLIPGLTWPDALAGAAVATLYSVLMSIVSYPATGTPSLLPKRILRRRSQRTEEDSLSE